MSFEAGIASYIEEKFIQDCVLVKSIYPNNLDVDLKDNIGTLSITQDIRCDSEIFIEWRQCDVVVESEDQEWAVVQGGFNGRRRTRSGCSGGLRPPIIQLRLSNLKSFQVSKNKLQITLFLNGDVSSCCFYLQRGSTDHFINCLKPLINALACRKDPMVHVVIDQEEVLPLNKSFDQLDLFTESKADVISTMLQRFQKRPYETTMGAFAKISDILLFNKPEDEMNEMAERLTTSFQLEDELAQIRHFYEPLPLPLPPRISPPRCLPLRRDQWENMFNENGSIMDVDSVKNMIFRGGVCPDIRKEVWKYLLEYYPWNSTHEERKLLKKYKTEEYYRMKLQWQTLSKDQEERFADYKERKNLIEKDVIRTDRVMPFYAEDDNPNLKLLQDILMTYVMYNFDLGYVQGMSDLLSPVLFLIQDEVESFWCFTALIKHMVHNFDIDQAGMKEQLQQLYQLLTTLEPDLANFLLRKESSNMFFCFRWLLVWFKREFSFDDIYILWETLWAENRCKNYHLLICVAILEIEKETLMSNDYGFTEILKHINELSNNLNLATILRKAEGIYLQLENASEIPNETKLIMGFPLAPSPISTPSEATSENEAKLCETGAVSNGAISFNVDKEELAFENSMSMQFF